MLWKHDSISISGPYISSFLVSLFSGNGMTSIYQLVTPWIWAAVILSFPSSSIYIFTLHRACHFFSQDAPQICLFLSISSITASVRASILSWLHGRNDHLTTLLPFVLGLPQSILHIDPEWSLRNLQVSCHSPLHLKSEIFSVIYKAWANP